MTDLAQPMPVGKRLKRLIRDYPLIPLIVLLILLVGVLEIMRPGIVNERWAGNTIRFAIPLAMLAACQTLTMLTGGIDLSAGTAPRSAPSSWRRRRRSTGRGSPC
jgi:ribose transport system permease protein